MSNSSRRFSVCVYCGSRDGRDAAHLDAARLIGREIGDRGWELVYGGGRVGLMGAVADAVLERGGPVYGVIPTSLMEREVGHPRLTELHVVQTMHERKLMMAERADVFVALPGGIGTFEELFETWSWRQLGYHDKPIGLLNLAGYYDTLLRFMRETVDAGFVSASLADMLVVEERAPALLDRLAAEARTRLAPDDYRRI